MECPICYTKIKQNDKFTILNCNCSTAYHNKCIDEWFSYNNSCPTCRKKWIPPKLSSQPNQNNRVPRRRNAMTPEMARDLTNRLFLESIGINSSRHNIDNLENYEIETEINI
tara:strand:- start:1027 stop:1362 length:336 start_codon:yes stop_codon:yes gene_type:complete